MTARPLRRAATVLVCGLAAGCLPGAPVPAPAPPGFPVTVTTCGTPVTYPAPPTRAVTNDINTTEDLIALGLAHRLVGTFGVRGDAAPGKGLPPAYRRAAAGVRAVSPDQVTLEPLVALRPDFLFAGWNYGLHPGTPLSPEPLARRGIATLVLTESCAHVTPDPPPVTVEATYRDLRALGTIFAVPDRATALIERMTAEIADAHRRVAGRPPVRVFVYDSGEAAPLTAPGLAVPTALLAQAGGHNVFADLRRTWTTVSWEQVAAADPHCILINNYGTTTAEHKRAFLEGNPLTRHLTAVREHCFLTLDYDQLTPGPRNAEAVTALARWLHPEAFDPPPR